MRRLAAHAQVYWVGRSPAVPPGTTMADLAEDYARAIRAHFGHPVPVVGFSTGGFLGLQLTVDHPEVVERLVVVWAAHRLSEQGRASNRRWVAALEQGRVSDAWKELARDVVSSEPARSLVGAALATIGPFLTPGGFSDGIRTAQAEESFDLRDSLDRISTPTLLVVGEKDDNCGVDLISETRNRIPGADLALLPGVGHLGSITDREGSGGSWSSLACDWQVTGPSAATRS